MSEVARRIEQERQNAGMVARFDPSPEASLARRYEAAAERGMYQAVRGIASLNRQAGRAEAAPASSQATDLQPALDLLNLISPGRIPAPAPAPPPPNRRNEPPVMTLGSFRAAGSEPLASFRAGVVPAEISSPELIESALLDRSGGSARPGRPDLRKLNQKRAGSRR